MSQLCRIIVVPLSVVAIGLWLTACGSSDGTSTTAAASSTSVTRAVPTDVAIASPTASTSGSSSVSAGKSVGKALAGDATNNSYKAKQDSAEALQAGTGDCGFTPSLTLPTPPACYGPQINYTNQPDGSPTTGSLPVKDTGFWNLTEGTEACAAAQMNFLINSVATRVDMMMNMFNNMVCVGKKAGLALPTAAGGSTNFKTALGEKSTHSGITINTATIERLADDSDGNAVYKSTVSVTMGTHTGTAILKHIITGTDAAGNNNYKGKLSMTMSNETAMDTSNCTGAAAGSVNAGVVKYVKSSATSLIQEVNYAEFCGADASPLDSSNNIVRTNTFNSSTNKTGWGSNWNHGLFSLDPTTGMGTVAYSWQAGYGDGRTRVLNATVTQAADTSASGTAYYGFGPDVNGTGTLGSIEGFICNWAGPNGAVFGVTNRLNRTNALMTVSTPAREVNNAQKQILARAVGGTVFTTTAANSKITYAPANSCNKATPLNAAFTFIAVNPVTSAALSHTNDISTAAAVTHNLALVSEISSNFTLPTAPADVGS